MAFEWELDPSPSLFSRTTMKSIFTSEAAENLDRAFREFLASGTRTPDLGGTAATDGFADAVIAAM